MINKIETSNINSVISDLFGFFTEDEKLERNGKEYPVSDLKIIAKIDIVSGDKKIGVIEVQGSTYYDERYVRIAYQLNGSPVVSMVGRPSFFLELDFKIKEFTVTDYIDKMLSRRILISVFDYKFGEYFNGSEFSKRYKSDMEHNYNSLTKNLERLCSYGLLLNINKKSVIFKEDLKPVEFYASLVLANEYKGMCDYYDTCE